MFFRSVPPVALLVVLLHSCSEPASNGTSGQPSQPVRTMDKHSYADPTQAVITHLDLDIRVDMATRTISGKAMYDLERKQGKTVVFDTDGLTIDSVTLTDGTPVPFNLGDSTFLGRALTVELPDSANRISIAYRCGQGARALQ